MNQPGTSGMAIAPVGVSLKDSWYCAITDPAGVMSYQGYTETVFSRQSSAPESRVLAQLFPSPLNHSKLPF